EVRLVPAAAFQAKRRRGHEPDERALAAVRALLERRIRNFLQRFHVVAAGFAAVLVYRHASILAPTGALPLERGGNYPKPASGRQCHGTQVRTAARPDRAARPSKSASRGGVCRIP